MYYILEKNIRVKKWMSGAACYSIEGKTKQFSLKPEEYALIKRCDGITELPESNALYVLEALGVIRRCRKGEAGFPLTASAPMTGFGSMRAVRRASGGLSGQVKTRG